MRTVLRFCVQQPDRAKRLLAEYGKERKTSVRSALSALGVLTMTAMAQPASAALIHSYDFLTSTTTVVDGVGGANGTLMNGATIGEGALQLNGSNQYVQFSSYLVPTGSSPYSVALTFDAASFGGFNELISQGGKSNGSPFYIGTRSGGAIRATDEYQSLSVTIPTGQTTTLLYTFAEGAQALYLNGALVFSGTGTYTMDPADTFTRLGAQFEGPSEFWNGSISSVQIYSTVITPADLATPAPEPTSGALLFAGLACLAARRHSARDRLKVMHPSDIAHG